MSTNKTKKVKMATKSCPECDQQIPVACKSCPCGYVFISRKLLNARLSMLDFKRRRTERIRKERIDSTLTNDAENPRRPRANSQSDPTRRGRGRPKTVGQKKQEDEKEKQEKEVDVYAALSDEKAFVFSVALAEINRKILAQRLIL
uniref:Chromosome 16 open reading frame 87 n=1 Tax=Oryzias melastigma TaxID=30732 RepID=A0A3B3CZW5_ORYME